MPQRGDKTINIELIDERIQANKDDIKELHDTYESKTEHKADIAALEAKIASLYEKYTYLRNAFYGIGSAVLLAVLKQLLNLINL